MTTRAFRAAIPLAAVFILLPAVVGACSGDDAESVTTGSASSTSAAPSTAAPTTAATTTTEGASGTIVVTIPATADLPQVSVAPPGTADLPLVIDVTVGVDSSPQRIEQVPVGTPVTLQLVNPDATDEYHVHGIDLGDGQTFAAGQRASFTFTLDTPGRYEVESHTTDTVLVIIEAV